MKLFYFLSTVDPINLKELFSYVVSFVLFLIDLN